MTARKTTASLYSVMTCEGVYPPTMVQLKSEWDGPPWLMGSLLALPVPDPVLFELNPRYPGKLLPMYEGTIPLMSEELLRVLHSAGVANIELYPARIDDPHGGRSLHQYKAFNVVGLVACADMERSEYLEDGDDDMPLMFDSLCIDDAKAHGALLFRLAEAPTALVVHQRIRQAVERQVPGMTFHGPGEWSG